MDVDEHSIPLWRLLIPSCSKLRFLCITCIVSYRSVVVWYCLFITQITNRFATCCTAAASILLRLPKFPAFTLGREVGYLTLEVVLSSNRDSRPVVMWGMTAFSLIFFNQLFPTKPLIGCYYFKLLIEWLPKPVVRSGSLW
jgi:hypothetical protein